MPRRSDPGQYSSAGMIVKQFPEHAACVEVFGGGDLVNLFRVVRRRPSSLVERLSLVLYSREAYKEFISKWKEKPYDEVDRAASFLCVARSAPNPPLDGLWKDKKIAGGDQSGFHFRSPKTIESGLYRQPVLGKSRRRFRFKGDSVLSRPALLDSR